MTPTYPVKDLTEMYSNSGTIYVWKLARRMYEDRDFLGADFSCSIAKHKQHGVYHIAFSTTIWSNNSCETLKRSKPDKDKIRLSQRKKLDS